MKKDLSLIVPCYNEENHIVDSYKKLKKELNLMNITYEFLFIDDKSIDDTKNKILTICKNDKNAKYIFHSKNVGRGGTVTEGVKKSTSTYVGFVDIDLEISQKYIPFFFKQLEKGSDVVIAKRTYPFSILSLIRIIMSKGYMFLRNTFLPLPISDTEAGYKFFNRNKILPVIKKVKDKKWFWDTEIITQAFLNDLSIVEIPVIFLRRKDKISTVKIYKDSFEYLRQLVKTRKDIYGGYFIFFQLLSVYKNSLLGTVYFIGKWLLFPFNEIEKYIPKKGKIIDIGCGEGIMTFLLALTSPYRSVTGIDLSSERIEITKTKKIIKNINFIRTNAVSYSYPKINGVILSDFLHHLNKQDQEKLLQNVAESLSKNGVMVIKEVDDNAVLRKWLSRLWDFLLYPKDKINYRTVNEWRKILIKNNLNVDIKHTSLLSPFSTVLIIGTKK